MNIQMTDKERLNAIIKFSGMSTRAFGIHIGVKTPQTLYDILNGKHGISKDLADRISVSYLNINKGWLLTGEGEMKNDDTHLEEKTEVPKASSSLDILAKAIETLSESEKTNTQNIQELIAQGREQTNNITKLVDLLCKSGILTDILSDSEKRGQSSGKDTDDNTASIAGSADAG